MTARRLAARAAFAAAAIALLLGAAHALVLRWARIPAPDVTLPPTSRTVEGGVARAAGASARRVGSLLVVRLRGTPEELGATHSTLLHDEMVRTEGVVWGLLESKVPNPLARWLLLDAAQLAYSGVADSMSQDRRAELAAAARAFAPDPYADRFAAFQRFVYLSALYDISLAYERSPLVGCTTFSVSGPAAPGSPLLARAFDFDVSDVYDEDKAVFLVEEAGRIPFASVAWPGLVGVVSGMNVEGVAVVVHGARAGPVRTTGEPLVHELRRVLSTTRTTDEAVLALGETEPLVSHVLVISDASGHAVAVERVPSAPPFARPLPERAVVTNHLEGPFSGDPKDALVRASTSTLDRRARGEELVARLRAPVTAADAVALLRDRRGVGDRELPLGDRRAVDALIATHGVVMETATRRLWVSEAPHLLGRFAAFDLATLLAPGRPDDAGASAWLPEDPLLRTEEFRRAHAH